ncbi:flagellar biosynthesis protein FlhB [Zavarzinia sp. CC-PAN008]|uniref:flagellar biosynthesis protein FlhB n=1 Tax=Zavarzinia sp. CC-PAN008 TaxID=3243332 RepID=UPI003F74385B
MAGEDDSDKTEEASPRKLEQARERGEVPSSQEVNHWFMLLGATAMVALFGGTIAGSLSREFAAFLDGVGTQAVDGGTLMGEMRTIGLVMMAALGLPFLCLIVAAIGGHMVQKPMMFTADRIAPKFSKISPMAGLKRQFSSKALVEFAKGLLKITLVGIAVLALLWPERDRIAGLVTVPVDQALLLGRDLVLEALLVALIMMGVIAGADYFWQRFSFMREQRMSKQEVKDERKQSDGDPMVKGRLRQIRLERSRRRMMAAVPTADVVITNPTHYAVALKYDGQTMAAPKVVAKGVDAVAARIRALAEENNVPLVENPPLARALHASVELDREVPTEHYRAVAEVIGYVMRLKRGRGRP